MRLVDEIFYGVEPRVMELFKRLNIRNLHLFTSLRRDGNLPFILLWDELFSDSGLFRARIDWKSGWDYVPWRRLRGPSQPEFNTPQTSYTIILPLESTLPSTDPGPQNTTSTSLDRFENLPIKSRSELSSVVLPCIEFARKRQRRNSEKNSWKMVSSSLSNIGGMRLTPRLRGTATIIHRTVFVQVPNDLWSSNLKYWSVNQSDWMSHNRQSLDYEIERLGLWSMLAVSRW